MVLLKEDYLTITLDKTYGFIHQKWVGFANSTDFRQSIDFFYKKLVEHNLHKVVIDVSEQRSPSKSDMDYASQSINKTARHSSTPIKCAFVMPKSAILQIGMKFFGKMIMGIKDVDIQFVKTEEEALQWIKSV